MTAGQVWRRPDGLHWVEVQVETVEPSGWRLMVPLVEPTEAVEAPPLVVRIGPWLGRAHMVTSVPAGELGRLVGEVDGHDLSVSRGALCGLLGTALPSEP